MLEKQSLRKKSGRVLQQKPFRCQLPQKMVREGHSPTSFRGFAFRGVQSKTSEGVNNLNSPTADKRTSEMRQSQLEPNKARKLKHLKSQPNLKNILVSGRHLDVGCSPNNREETDGSISHRISKFSTPQESEKTSLKEAVNFSKKSYLRLPLRREPQIDHERLQAEHAELQREISMLRRSNDELRTENGSLRQELTKLRREKILTGEVHKAEVSRLNLEISRLKIVLLQTVEEINKQEHTKEQSRQSTERINHVYTYERYDKPRSSHLQRISEIDPKLEMSSINARHGEIDKDKTHKKTERNSSNNGLSNSSQQIRLEESTINTNDNRNPSFLSNEIDFLEIDSKESSVNRT